MFRFAIGLGLSLLIASGCGDPKDPATWIKKLRDVTKPSAAMPTGARFSVEAVRKLQELGDASAVPALIDLYKDHQHPIILRALISFKDKRAVPTLIGALDFSEDQYRNATLAASALADLGATEAVGPMSKVLQRPLPIKSRANLAKLATIRALAKLGDKGAVPELIATLERRPEQQDFLLAKEAATALGQIGDPQAVPVLIRGLYMSSTIQGSAYPHARVALVQIGRPAVQPLVAAMEGRDEKLNTMAKELEFRPGVLEQKAAMVLGDIGDATAVPALLKQLAKYDLTETKAAGTIEALGKIGDKSAVEALIKVLTDKKANYKLRIQVCQALTVIGDKRALGPLLEIAEKGFIEGGYTNLREGAAMAYGRIVGAEAVEGIKKLEAFVNEDKIKAFKQTQATFQEAVDRAKIAVECKDDPLCYGKQVNNAKLSLAQREKAGIMIGILPNGRAALADLVKALPNREPILRLFFLESAKRIGKASDKALVDTLTELAAKDSKRKTKFLGADLASADKIALAIVLRNK